MRLCRSVFNLSGSTCILTIDMIDWRLFFTLWWVSFTRSLLRSSASASCDLRCWSRRSSLMIQTMAPASANAVGSAKKSVAKVLRRNSEKAFSVLIEASAT